jgi:phosphatidylglycerol lysyltransferase
VAYLAALAAGLASQSPGGVGVFEATLLALLPEVPAGEVLAAALGYRLAYHAAPAATALVLLIAERPPGPCPLAPAAGADLHRALAGAPQAEWGLARQGASVLLSRNGAEGWLTPEAGRWLVALACRSRARTSRRSVRRPPPED